MSLVKIVAVLFRSIHSTLWLELKLSVILDKNITEAVQAVHLSTFFDATIHIKAIVMLQIIYKDLTDGLYHS